MPVYMIIDITVLKPEIYDKYIEKVKPIIESHGGRYLARGGKITSSSGDWKPERIIIIEFDDMRLLQDCFKSNEYKEIASLRESSTLSRSIIVEGIQSPKED